MQLALLFVVPSFVCHIFAIYLLNECDSDGLLRSIIKLLEYILHSAIMKFDKQ